MPSIPLHLPSVDSTKPHTPSNPLPQLLQTPSGLAILEIQGKINLPAPDASILASTTPVGRLTFPHYREDDPPTDTAWMRTAHLYVGRYQRLTGEVKKLVNPLAVIRRRGRDVNKTEEGEEEVGDGVEELEIVELIYHKIVFSSRPEPVGEGSL